MEAAEEAASAIQVEPTEGNSCSHSGGGNIGGSSIAIQVEAAEETAVAIQVEAAEETAAAAAIQVEAA